MLGCSPDSSWKPLFAKLILHSNVMRLHKKIKKMNKSRTAQPYLLRTIYQFQSLFQLGQRPQWPWRPLDVKDTDYRITLLLLIYSCHQNLQSGRRLNKALVIRSSDTRDLVLNCLLKNLTSTPSSEESATRQSPFNSRIKMKETKRKYTRKTHKQRPLAQKFCNQTVDSSD